MHQLSSLASHTTPGACSTLRRVEPYATGKPLAHDPESEHLAVPSDGSNPMQPAMPNVKLSDTTTLQYPQTGRTLCNTLLSPSALFLSLWSVPSHGSTPMPHRETHAC